jgi:hypothetical protein
MPNEGLKPLRESEFVEVIQKNITEVEDELNTFNALLCNRQVKLNTFCSLILNSFIAENGNSMLHAIAVSV